MSRIAIAFALLASCASPADIVQDICGPAPLAPGWTVGYSATTVTMDRADFSAIEAWRVAVEDWETCVINLRHDDFL